MLQGNVQWTNMNFPVDVTPISLTTYPGNSNVILVGTKEGGIYITTDGGNNWTKERYFPNVQVSEMRFRAADKKLFVFTYGRGAWSANLNLSVIPLQVLNFTGKVTANSMANLNWSTIDESGVLHFEIEGRSKTGAFTTLKSVTAAGSGDHTYSTDINMAEPEMYYRLKAVKAGGDFLFSNTIRLKIPVKNNLNVHYYPSDKSLHITLSPEMRNSNAIIYDAAGKRIKLIPLRELNTVVYMGLLAPGVYYLNADQQTQAFLVY